MLAVSSLTFYLFKLSEDKKPQKRKKLIFFKSFQEGRKTFLIKTKIPFGNLEAHQAFVLAES